MKKNSFWDTLSNYMKLQIIVIGIILVVLFLIAIGKSLVN